MMRDIIEFIKEDRFRGVLILWITAVALLMPGVAVYYVYSLAPSAAARTGIIIHVPLRPTIVHDESDNQQDDTPFDQLYKADNQND